MLLGRLAGILLLAVVAVSALGARCIENVAVLTDEQGNTYLLGEIFNDTDVQGTQVVVHATLFGGDGAVIASKDVTMCPGDLPPHGHRAYGVRFNEPNLPRPTRYEVRPVAGKTLDRPLPSSNLAIAEYTARFDGENVIARFGVKNNGTASLLHPQLCVVAYDTAGKVRSLSPFDPKLDHTDTTLRQGQTTDLSFSLHGQAGASTLRVWVWIPGTAGSTSPFQPLMSDAIAIAP